MDLKQIQKRALEIREKYAILEQKKKGNSWTNSQIMEGFVGDIGDLMKLVMAKEGAREIENVDEKLAHELSDCLWCIFMLADKYKIDLETSFLKTMSALDKHINKESSI